MLWMVSLYGLAKVIWGFKGPNFEGNFDNSSLGFSKGANANDVYPLHSFKAWTLNVLVSLFLFSGRFLLAGLVASKWNGDILLKSGFKVIFLHSWSCFSWFEFSGVWINLRRDFGTLLCVLHFKGRWFNFFRLIGLHSLLGWFPSERTKFRNVSQR